jgi:hypothetical protein
LSGSPTAWSYGVTFRGCSGIVPTAAASLVLGAQGDSLHADG